MKYLALILLIALTACSGDKMSTKEIGERVSKIRKELLERKELPEKLKRSPGYIGAPANYHSIFYNTSRKIKSDTEIVSIDIFINDEDSLERISFTEMCFAPIHDTSIVNGNEDRSYHYSVGKAGVIDEAFYMIPLPVEDKDANIESVKSTFPMTPRVLEINLHPWPPDSVIKPDAKTEEFYNAKLIATLDELEKILFSK